MQTFVGRAATRIRLEDQCDVMLSASFQGRCSNRLSHLGVRRWFVVGRVRSPREWCGRSSTWRWCSLRSERKDAAVEQACVAHEELQRVRAEREAQRASARLSETDCVSPEAMTVLTPREREVLKLIAQGLSNPKSLNGSFSARTPWTGTWPTCCGSSTSPRAPRPRPARRARLSLARSGHLLRAREIGPYRRSDERFIAPYLTQHRRRLRRKRRCLPDR